MTRPVVMFALSAAVLLPAPSGAAEVEGHARVSLWGLIDSNVRREYDDGEPDVAVSALGSLEGRVTFETAQLLGRYDVGARKYALTASEDAVAQSLEGEGSVALAKTLGLGLVARGRDRRPGPRAYSDLSAQGFLDFVPDGALSVRAFGGGHRFIYWRAFRHSFSATELGATVRYRIDRLHTLHVFGELGLRRHNAEAQARDDTVPPDSGTCVPTRPLGYRRTDSLVRTGVGWSLRGPVPLSVTYSYSDDASNSFGESWRQHRLAATAGFRLPWELTLLSQLSLQLADYPDGIFLSPEVVVEEDSENFNSLSLKVARPISSAIDLEAKWALYYSRLPEARLDAACVASQEGPAIGHLYVRQLYWLGATLRY
jgi:hypothetical protein